MQMSAVVAEWVVGVVKRQQQSLLKWGGGRRREATRVVEEGTER